MIDGIKKLLKPLASLRITVVLLLVSMVLVLAGTTAQRDMGIQDVQRQFFHSWWAKIHFHYFAPEGKNGQFAIDNLLTGKSFSLPTWFPLPGGYSIIVAMLVNLLAAHSTRFRLRWNRTGIIMIHLGLILLLVGELMTSSFATEGQMRIDVGGSANYADDVRDSELAIIDPAPADHDQVTVIPAAILSSAVGGVPIHDSRLPFDVKVERWYDNSEPAGPQQSMADVDRLANAGAAKMLGIKRLAKYPGSEAEKVDVPSAFITLSKDGRILGTYLVSLFLNKGMNEMPGLQQPQEVTVDGKTYLFTLRFRRDYKPYTVYLDKFAHDVYLGTDEAKNFSSNIRLVDPARHVDRTVRIWMNHPLCYNGETFYQQSFANNDQTSVLQVVHNPASAWAYVAPVVNRIGIADDSYAAELFNLPCLACAIGGLGLLIHFGTKLLQFLNRTLAPAEGTVGAAARGQKQQPYSKNKNPAADRYTLAPKAKWPGLIAPVALVGLAIFFLAGWLSFSYPGDKYNWDGFGELPISHQGRILPLQTLAKNSLRLISGKDYLHDKNDELVSQSKWLMDVMSRSGQWADYKVFRIDHDQIKDTLGLLPKDRYFSWNDLFPKGRDNEGKLQEQIKLATQVPEKDRDLGQGQLLEFARHLNVVTNLQQISMIGEEREFSADASRSQAMMRELGAAIVKNDPQVLQKMQTAGDMELAQRLFNQAVLNLDQSQLTDDQRLAFKDWYLQQVRRMEVRRMPAESQLFLSAPLSSGEQWTPIGNVIEDGAPVPESATAFLKIVSDYQRQDASAFNADLAAYRTRLDSALPSEMHKASAEVFFNNFDPFFVSMLLYIGVFIVVCTSWLVLRKPLGRAALSLMIFTLLIHTVGLGFRVFLTEHGPVTNLYSSAIFIGWVIILLSLALEGIFRNGIGLAAGSAAGFTSLLIGAALASTEGDTMKQVVAVLDTNFWLWTHVTCVTIGYASTFLAGVLAIAYVGIHFFNPDFDKDNAKSLSRMTYGIICFALLFSFVGTILGGLWADKSWGRFWGWDPKENGAVLIVLWNALILHARWGGMVRERGVAVLAIIGNIVTSWSWFGTNMLGIGLHSYGFMRSAQYWLVAFMISQVLIALIGTVRLRRGLLGRSQAA